ncbi:MAG TPA: DMT family transporter [Tenuifilaceae bacterium]|nr:DMT family transporter [Tenuifilaceae bacterium]
MTLNEKTGMKAYIAVFIAMFFWAYSFIWYKEAYVYYRPITLLMGRLIVSSIFLFTVSGLMGKLNKIRKSDIKFFALLAFFEPFLYFIGESFGLTYISSTLAAVIVSTIPLISPIGEYYIYKQRISTMNFVGIMVSIIGVGMVIFYKGFGHVEANVYGILLMILAVFSTVGYSLLLRKLTANYNVFSIITYQNTIGIFYFLPLFLLFEYKNFIQVGITLHSALPVLKLGIFASTFAFLLFTFSLKHMGVTKANSFTNAIPVLTAILSYFILGEMLTTIKILGILVVVLGLFLSQAKGYKVKRVFAFIPVGLITRARLRKNDQ